MPRESGIYPVAVWAVLVLATLLSWLTGVFDIFGGSTTPYTLLGILLISYLKSRMVILDFMEIRHAPKTLRFALESWAAAVIIILYYFFAIG